MASFLCTAIATVAITAGVAVLGAALWATHRIPAWGFASSTVLLTGGSTGIGLETARQLVRKRVRFLVIAARREGVLRDAVKELEAEAAAVGSPTRVHYIVMDVCDESSVERGVTTAQRLCEGQAIDLLICNAGFAYPARFLDCTMDDARQAMDTNYFGCVSAMQCVLPAMVAAGKGRIVLTSSMAARGCIAGYTLYSATKAAVRALAHSTDMEHSYSGVRVQVASPPDVATPGYEHENEAKSPECAAISAIGGATPFTAAQMGSAMIAGIEHYRFDITLGSDGWFLSLGGACMEPSSSLTTLLLQVAVGGPLRLALAVVAKMQYNVVKRIRGMEAALRKKD